MKKYPFPPHIRIWCCWPANSPHHWYSLLKTTISSAPDGRRSEIWSLCWHPSSQSLSFSPLHHMVSRMSPTILSFMVSETACNTVKTGLWMTRETPQQELSLFHKHEDLSSGPCTHIKRLAVAAQMAVTPILSDNGDRGMTWACWSSASPRFSERSLVSG